MIDKSKIAVPAVSVVLLLMAATTQINWLSQVINKPVADTREFTFTRTPGGTLTAATPATVTLAPVPIGVNGTDVGHYLYVSAGTGTAEWALITGGTAVSGASSGTITFTPANNHSGAWTIQSATAGGQEALNSLGAGGGTVVYPPGTSAVCGLFVGSAAYTGVPVTVSGQGEGATILNCLSTTIPVISVQSVHPRIVDLTVSHTGITPAAGGNGIVTSTGGTDYPMIERVTALNNYSGMYLGTVSIGTVKDCTLKSNVSDGITFDPLSNMEQWDVIDNLATLNGGAAYNWTTSAGGPGPRFRGNHTYANQGGGYKLSTSGNPISGVTIDGGFLGNDGADEIYYDTLGGINNHIRGVNMESAGDCTVSVGYPAASCTPSTTAMGINVTAANHPRNLVVPVLIEGNTINSSAGSGIYAGAASTVIENNILANNGVAAGADVDRAGIVVASTYITTRGNHCGAQVATTQKWCKYVTGNAVGGDLILGPDMVDPANSQIDVKYNVAPRYIGRHDPASYSERFGASCTTAASAGATCTGSYTLTTARYSGNYTVSCSIVGVASGVPSGPVITAVSPTAITVQITAITAAAAQASAVHCNFRQD